MSPGLLLALAPIVVIQIGLLIYALTDLMKVERLVKGGNKTVWLLVIVLVNVIGPILYLTVGREGERWEPPSELRG